MLYLKYFILFLARTAFIGECYFQRVDSCTSRVMSIFGTKIIRHVSINKAG